MSIIKKFVDYFILVLLTGMILIVPAVYISNHADPGSPFYSFKLKFEGLILAASGILNKQVDFSMDLVMQRSNEATKTIALNSSNVDYVQQTLDRLDAQMVQTGDSISKISDPVQKRQEAAKYIAQLNQVSSSLNQQQRTIASNSNGTQNGQTQPAGSNNTNTNATTSSSSVSQQIDNTQQTIQQTIGQMTDITASSNNISPTAAPTLTIAPTSTPVPTQPVVNQTNDNGNNLYNFHKNSKYSD